MNIALHDYAFPLPISMRLCRNTCCMQTGKVSQSYALAPNPFPCTNCAALTEYVYILRRYLQPATRKSRRIPAIPAHYSPPTWQQACGRRIARQQGHRAPFFYNEQHIVDHSPIKPSILCVSAEKLRHPPPIHEQSPSKAGAFSPSRCFRRTVPAPWRIVDADRGLAKDLREPSQQKPCHKRAAKNRLPRCAATGHLYREIVYTPRIFAVLPQGYSARVGR